MDPKEAQIEYVGELVGNIVKDYVRLHPHILPNVLPRTEEDQYEIDRLTQTVRELKIEQDHLNSKINYWRNRAMMRFEEEATLLDELKELPEFSIDNFKDILASDDFSVFIGSLYSADMPERIYEQMKYILKVDNKGEYQWIRDMFKRWLQCCLNLRNKTLSRRRYQLWEPKRGVKYDPQSMAAVGKVIQGTVEQVLIPGILVVQDEKESRVNQPCIVTLA